MKNLPQPNSQLEETLYDLLIQPSTSRLRLISEYGILNPTARISDLRIRYNLDIPMIKMVTHNKFGRKVDYAHWKLTNKDNALKVYYRLTGKKLTSGAKNIEVISEEVM